MVFNKVKNRIGREDLLNGCYTSVNSEIIDKVQSENYDIDEVFDPIVELFYNILDKQGRLQ